MLYIYMIDSSVDFFVWVSKNKISSDVHGDCEVSVQLAICWQDHKWSRSEGWRKELMVGSNTPLSLILPPLISKSLIPFRMVALHLFLSSAKSSKVLTGILVAERLYFSLFLYRSQCRPVFLFPSFSSLYIRIFGICSSLIHHMISPSLLGLHEERFKTSNPTSCEKINIWHFISERVSTYSIRGRRRAD